VWTGFRLFNSSAAGSLSISLDTGALPKQLRRRIQVKTLRVANFSGINRVPLFISEIFEKIPVFFEKKMQRIMLFTINLYDRLFSHVPFPGVPFQLPSCILMHPSRTLHVPLMYPLCTPRVPLMYCSCTPRVPLMYCSCTPHVPLTYTSRTPHVPLTYPSCTPHVPLMYPSCHPHVPLMYPSCSVGQAWHEGLVW
jgi:hypothetical protein